MEENKTLINDRTALEALESATELVAFVVNDEIPEDEDMDIPDLETNENDGNVDEILDNEDVISDLKTNENEVNVVPEPEITNAVLDSYKVHELMDFIKSRRPNLRCSGWGKDRLKNLAKSILKHQNDSNQPKLVLDMDVFHEIELKRKCFANHDLNWMDYTKIKKKQIPSGFGQYVIHKFLTETFIKAFEGQEAVATGIKRAADKGSQMYKSKKIQFVEFSVNDDPNLILFRGHVMASYKKEIRYIIHILL